MAYNNPSGEATYTYTDTGALILDPAVSGLIASSATADSQYYAKALTIDGGANVSSATIGDKGVLKTNGSAIKITVLSGGTLSRTAGTSKIYGDLTVMSGGTALGFTGGHAFWSGTWNIQSGANMFGFTDVYTDAAGYLNYGGHGITGAVNTYIKIRNINCNSYLYVYGGGVSGATVQGGATAAKLAYLDLMKANVSAYDVRVLSGGSIHCRTGNMKLFDIVGDDGARMYIQANCSLGGQKTTFARGFLTKNGMDTSTPRTGRSTTGSSPTTRRRCTSTTSRSTPSTRPTSTSTSAPARSPAKPPSAAPRAI